MKYQHAKQLFGKNFIGIEELQLFGQQSGIDFSSVAFNNIPDIDYDPVLLGQCKDSHVLILFYPASLNGMPFNLVTLKKFFGTNPGIQEPCFYDQDWYLHEKFANECQLPTAWHLIRKQLLDETRAKLPEQQKTVSIEKLPSALLIAFTFFAYYFINKELLWPTDFIWCLDVDQNGDRIYVARYYDPAGIAKNGFSIHRHLSIRPNYGCL